MVDRTWFLMFCGLRMGRYSDTLSQLLPWRAYACRIELQHKGVMLCAGWNCA